MKTVVLLLALLTIGAPSHAEEIVFTGNATRAPKIFADPRGVADGVLIQIMNHVQKESGLTFSYKLYPWPRAYKKAVDGETGIIGLSKTKERQTIFDYGHEPLFVDELVLVVRAGKEFPFEGVNDLMGKRIGVCKDCSYGDTYDAAVKGRIFEPVPGNTTSSQLAMLLYDRIDAVLIPVGKAGLEEALNDADFKKQADINRASFAILPKPFARDLNYVAFAKSMAKTELLGKIDQVLKKGREDGTIQAIVDNYIVTRNR